MIGPREYPSAPIVGVGAVVIEGDRVLLIRRNHQPRLGQWSIPGGAVELGETMEQAILREVMEETGVAVEPLAILKALDKIERDSTGRVQFHYVLIDFLCMLAGPSKTPRAASDVSDARWVPLASLRVPGEVILPAWTLEVVEQGWKKAQSGEHLAR